MRLLPLAALIALGGCAGHVADYIGPRSEIVAPQLSRYGLDENRTRCMSVRLGERLTPLQLRLFARSAGSVTRGYFDPSRLSMRDLMHVAGSMDDPRVGQELVRAAAECDASPVLAVSRQEAAAVQEHAETSASEVSAPRPATWLNLGAAPTGQSIAVDASSLRQEGSFRTAWFRLTDPGAAGPDQNSYLLRVDCAGKTIDSQVRRKQDETGAVIERREDDAEPLPVEGGTVMEIAWLALCT